MIMINYNDNYIYFDLSLALLSQILAIVSISLIDLLAKFADECIASKTKQSWIILLVKFVLLFYSLF